MPFQREPHTFGAHAVAVVLDLYESLAALAQRHGNPRCARVDGVLDQLFDHTRRTVHDLTRRDLVDQRVGQATDRRQGAVEGFVGFRIHARTLAL